MNSLTPIPSEKLDVKILRKYIDDIFVECGEQPSIRVPNLSSSYSNNKEKIRSSS
jgi:hypothetical protein